MRLAIAYLEIHLAELVTPLDKKRRTYIEVELRKGVRTFRLEGQSGDHIRSLALYTDTSDTYQVCIPHPDGILYTDFPHQETIHPSKSELHEFDILGLQVSGERC